MDSPRRARWESPARRGVNKGGRAGWYHSALAIVLLLFATAAGAQPRQFRHYTPVDGLPQAQVLALHQDAHGFLWAGTYGGLARFDGRVFSRFSTADGLSSNTVQSLASEPDGTLWAGQSHGLCALRPQQVRFDCLALKGISDGDVQTLLQSAEGLWVGTTEGLYLLRRHPDGRFEAAAVMKGEVTALAAAGAGRVWVGLRQGLWQTDAAGAARRIELPGSHDVQALLVHGERLWIGTGTGLLLRHGEQVSVAPGLPPEPRGLAVRSLALAPDGSLLAATRLGLLREQADGFVLLKRRDGLSDDSLLCVILDREGLIWIAGDGGLSSLVDAAFAGYRQRDGLWHNFIRAIDEDPRGRLWLGTRHGVQVVRVDGSGRLVEQFRITHSDGLVDARIYAIAFPAENEALLATGHGLAHWREGHGLLHLYTQADGLPDNAVRALQRLDDGSLVIGTMAGVATLRAGVITRSEHPTLARAQIISIGKDRAGRLLFGSAQHGLMMLAPGGSVQFLNAGNGLSDETIWDTAVDARGGVWIGTNGDGLFHLDARGKLRRYTTREGLVDNFVWQVLVDSDGHVWSYTNRGLSRFDGTDFLNYGVDDGLLDLEGSATASVQTTLGQRWFASGEGLMRYIDTERKVAAATPAVTIYQALAGGAPMPAGGALDADARSFEFHFAAPMFRRNSELLYRYRLRGAGEEWVELRTHRPIAFANLGAGKYVFQAQARTAGQPWPKSVAAFAFEIRPPLWQRPLFQLLLALAVVLSLWWAVRFRVRQIEQGRHALELLVRERTEALQHANHQLELAAFTDPLTELRNRRYFGSQVGIDIAQIARSYAGSSEPANRDMIFAMVDIDHFKQINDTYGHAVGDRVLREYAQLIGSVIRESDYAVRWGGEEFLLVARQTEAAQCGVFAERLIERVRTNRFAIDDAGTTIRSTCSVGLSHVPFIEGVPAALAWEQVIEICDVAVYLAKAGGRDGWVAVHGVPGRPILHADEFMQALKSDPSALAASGQVRLSGTRRPTA